MNEQLTVGYLTRFEMSQEETFLGAPCQSNSDINQAKNKSRLGLIVTGVVGGSLVALYAVTAPFVAPALRNVCLPFVPATTVQVANVLSALRARSGRLVDIGSGDGRIVIAAAKQGFRASGFELNPWLVWYSRYKAWREGVHHSTSFHISDLWKVSFASYSNVVIFGVPQMMERLENKLASELPSTAKVVACRFPFPTWVPEQTVGEGIDTVWVYDAKAFTTDSCHKTRTISEQSQQGL